MLIDGGEDDFARAEQLKTRFEAALKRRQPWEDHWQECYDLTLPQRAQFGAGSSAGSRLHDDVYDGTAADAVDQLAASLLANLTPPWSRWFGIVPGPDLPVEEGERIAPALSKISERLQAHFDRSNFAVEMHQCYLDLVTGGTACLALEPEQPGEMSAFRFTAVPLADLVLEEGPTGRLDVTFRRLELTAEQFTTRFPTQPLPKVLADDKAGTARTAVIEAVTPDGPAYRHEVILEEDEAGGPVLLASRRQAESPFINFRWLKAPGEIYGRSPVMKSLPDIKTANKVVELILKNASIAVTGIWQAEDDGVLNPATVELVPGAIIPKAVGSAGLSPLDMPGRFDVSQLVLDDLRNRIRHGLLIDRLAAMDARRMTATEVLEQSAEMARILGATYGRLQSELLTPLILRAVDILRSRGEVADIPIDGRLVTLDHLSPLAQAQAQRAVQSTLTWLEAASALGPQGQAVIDTAAAARWLGKTLGVPPDLMRDPASMQADLTTLAAQRAGLQRPVPPTAPTPPAQPTPITPASPSQA
ncbi:MAG: head-tail connector protein [Alphaproteobacteria bacterium]|nr:head-tail connector protein [Alphaproteobacteria bacterium SS10]